MRLAVIDPHDQVLIAWDSATVAKQAFAELVAADALTRVEGRWPRRKLTVDEPAVEQAVMRALDRLLLETIRL